MTVRTAVFGPTGQALPVVGQGTYLLEQDRGAAVTALRAGLDLGLTHVDTAEMYGSGEVEDLVGEALQGRRDEAFLVSKVLPSNASRRGTIEAAERSLARLRTDVLDLYLLHWDCGEFALAETVEAFEELAAAGKIRHWGVSNFDVAACERVEALAPGRMVCNQVLYHLDQRAIEHDIAPWCRAHDVAVVGYSSFGQGKFPTVPEPRAVTLAEIAARHGASPYTVALAFLLREPGLFTIPKSRRVEHLSANAAGAALQLSDEDVAALDAAFPRGESRALPML